MIQRHVKGTTNYSAIRPKHILDLKIPLPSKEMQEIIVTRMQNQTNIIKNVENTIHAVKNGITDTSDFEGDYEYKEIQDICTDILAGGTPSRKNPEYFKGDIPWLKISDLNRLDYTAESEEKITEDAVDSSSTKILSKETVLFTIFATIADASILGIDKACTNQAIVGLVPKDGIDPKFLMYSLYALKPYFLSKSRGVTQNNINLGMLKSSKIPILPMNKQKELVKQIDERKSILEELEKSKSNARNIIQNIVNNLFKTK